MRALYDLSKQIASYNFFEWLVQAHTFGATKVIFDIRNIKTNKWPIATVRQRFYSILAPGPALIGLSYEIFDGSQAGYATRAAEIAEPGGRAIVNFWKAGHRFKRLGVKYPEDGYRYTITLRKTQRSPTRDSDEKVWREFGKEIDALIIPDYDEQPIHLHKRVALYAGAEMNFFVSNGPGVLCSMTEYPCMMFNTHHAYGSFKADGLSWGVQYPWMLANQRAIWEEATAENIRKHFYEWKRNGQWIEPPPAPDTLDGD
jgi:hypothetical protein